MAVGMEKEKSPIATSDGIVDRTLFPIQRETYSVHINGVLNYTVSAIMLLGF